MTTTTHRIRTRLRASLALALLGGSLLAASCAAFMDAPVEDPLSELVGTWSLAALGGEPVNEAGDPDLQLTISPDGDVSGFSGVNRFTSRLDLDSLYAGRMEFAPIASTRMAGPPEAMELESRFLRALQLGGYFNLLDGGLYLMRDDISSVRLVRAQ